MDGARYKSASEADEKLHVVSRGPFLGPRKLFLAWARNLTSGLLYLQGFDRATAPTAGLRPLFSVDVEANDFNYFETATGVPMTTGITVALSSSETVYADPGGTPGSFLVTHS